MQFYLNHPDHLEHSLAGIGVPLKLSSVTVHMLLQYTLIA